MIEIRAGEVVTLTATKAFPVDVRDASQVQVGLGSYTAEPAAWVDPTVAPTYSDDGKTLTLGAKLGNGFLNADRTVYLWFNVLLPDGQRYIEPYTYHRLVFVGTGGTPPAVGQVYVQSISVNGGTAATPDTTGKVDLTVSGGGGSGTVTSVAGVEPVDGDVPLTAADVGADAAGSADAVQDGLDAEVTARTDADAATLVSANSYTDGKITDLVGAAPAALDTLKEIDDQLAADEGSAAALAATVATKAPLASPGFSGNPTAPTQSTGDNSTKLATTAYADAAAAAAGGSVSLTTVSTAGSSQAVTAPAHGSKAVRLVGSAASCAITATGGTAAEECAITLYLDQDATGGRAWTFSANVDWGTTGAPSFSTAAGKRDVVVLTTIDGGGSFFGGLVAVGLTVPTVPGQVTGLSVTPGNTQNVLSWTNGAANGSAITNCKIYRSTSSGTETLLTTIAAGTTYTDTGLTNGTTYYYKVSAVNGVGEGAQSSEASGTPSNVTTLVADTFTAADSTTSLVGRVTPTGAKTWTRSTNTPSVNWGINTNRAYKSSTGAGRIEVDAGQSGVTLTCDLTTGAVLNDAGLTFWSDGGGTNYCTLIADPGGWYIQAKVVNVNHAGSPAINTTYTVKIVCPAGGGLVQVYINGVLTVSGTITDAAVISNTRFGLIGNSTADHFWDNFAITQP